MADALHLDGEPAADGWAEELERDDDDDEESSADACLHSEYTLGAASEGPGDLVVGDGEASERAREVDERRDFALACREAVVQVGVGRDGEDEDAELGHAPAEDNGRDGELVLEGDAEEAEADDVCEGGSVRVLYRHPKHEETNAQKGIAK